MTSDTAIKLHDNIEAVIPDGFAYVVVIYPKGVQPPFPFEIVSSAAPQNIPIILKAAAVAASHQRRSSGIDTGDV